MTSDAAGAPTTPFADRLADAVERKRSQLVVGLDPVIDLLPVELRGEAQGGRVAAASAVERFCKGIVDAVAPYVVAVKPQAAFFEALGSDGWRALETVSAYAREAGLLVIADGKRCDIGSTARAYATAFLEPRSGDAPLADALTVSPYLGRDSIDPFLAACRRDGAGLFLLVRTSNAGATELQDATLSDGRPVWRHVAELVDTWGDDPGHRRADEILAPGVHELGDVPPDGTSVGEDRILQLRRACVRRSDEEEQPRAVPAARREEGVDRVPPEVRAHRERVCERRLAATRLEERSRVCTGRRADVAALPVRDHEQPRLARVRRDRLERAPAVAAECLEERCLRLHRHDVRRNRVDDPLAEALHGARGGGTTTLRLAPKLDGEQVDDRVERGDAELGWRAAEERRDQPELVRVLRGM